MKTTRVHGLVLGWVVAAGLAVGDEPKSTEATPVTPTSATAKLLIEIADDAELSLQAFWEPIVDTTYKLQEDARCAKVFASLRPEEATRVHGGKEFQALMPRDGVALGQIWRIDDEALLVFLRQLHPSASTNLHHGTGAGGA